MLYYAGVGSRTAPREACALLRRCGAYLARRGLGLRSGAADGADTAFELGCLDAGGVADIWLPWRGFANHADGYYPSEAHYAIAATVHPGWKFLTRGPRSLHARNVGQVLGALDPEPDPVAFAVCWTADGCIGKHSRTPKTGGTATAIILSEQYDIPVFNLANPGCVGRLKTFVKGLL